MRREAAIVLALLAPACGGSGNQATGTGGAGGGGGSGGHGGAASCQATRPADDTLAAQREACAFAAGARVKDTLGLTDAQRAAIPIKHLIIVTEENRSFDHYFGRLASSGQP